MSLACYGLLVTSVGSTLKESCGLTVINFTSAVICHLSLSRKTTVLILRSTGLHAPLMSPYFLLFKNGKAFLWYCSDLEMGFELLKWKSFVWKVTD